MAWRTLCFGKRDMPFNYCEFICDSKDDISNLPTNKTAAGYDGHEFTCSIGSAALILSDMIEYRLNCENIWTAYEDNASINVSVATTEEFKTYLSLE